MVQETRAREIRWQCSYVNYNGDRCELEATRRIHFSGDHPFSHIDVCPKHFSEYNHYVWVQEDLQNYGIN